MAPMESGTNLVRRAREHFTAGDSRGSATLLLRAAEAFSREGNPAKANWALGGAGYTSCLSGEARQGLTLLQQAAEQGYHELAQIDSLAKLQHRGKQLASDPAFRRIRKLVSQNADPIVTLEWHNQAIDHWRWMTFCRRRDLARLRRYLPRLSGANDLALFERCLSWVHTRFDHDPEHTASRPNPITILREAPTAQRFTCREYAILLSSVLQCLGHPARVLAALQRDYHHGGGKGHWVTEVWSRFLGRWIVMDPQNECIWKRGSEFLNACELRSALLQGATDRIAPVVRGRRAARLLPWLKQFQVLWFYPDQNYFTGWDFLGPVEELGSQPHLLFQRQPRASVVSHSAGDHLYPAMQKLHFAAALAGNRIRFALAHSHPFFTHYEISVDKTRWSRCSEHPVVPLRHGRITVRFRIAGRENRPSEQVGVTLETKGYGPTS